MVRLLEMTLTHWHCSNRCDSEIWISNYLWPQILLAIGPSLDAVFIFWGHHNKYHNLGGLNNRNLLSHNPGGQISEIKMLGVGSFCGLQGKGLFWDSLLGLVAGYLSFTGFSPCLCVLFLSLVVIYIFLKKDINVRPLNNNLIFSFSIYYLISK